MNYCRLTKDNVYNLDQSQRLFIVSICCNRAQSYIYPLQYFDCTYWLALFPCFT